MADWTDDILRFWFDELTPSDWFDATPEIDAQIRERFGELYEEQRGKVADDFLGSPNTALAAILLFDQFPRNMFRDDARAFATDHLALQIARRLVESEGDHRLTDEQRQFAYMPFMHSEELDDQTRSLGLFTALGNDEATRFAKKHRDMIARFGRFPHRNEPLGRDTRPEEQAAIDEGARW